MARWMHKAAIVRSVNHKAGCHNPLPSYTGYEVAAARHHQHQGHLPAEHGLGLRVPAQGQDDLPAYVYLPCYLGSGTGRSATPGRTPASSASATTRSSPSATRRDRSASDTGSRRSLRGEPLPAGTAGWPTASPSTALQTRAGLLQQFDASCAALEAEPRAGRLRPHPAAGLQPADLARKLKAAFDLEHGRPAAARPLRPDAVRPSTLIARRLVEAGVRFVNVTWDSSGTAQIIRRWDTHTTNFDPLRTTCPTLDLTYTALLEDLDDRGLLDETLVVVMSEMGRTPQVNGNARPRPLDVLLLRAVRRGRHPRRHGLRRLRRPGGLRQGPAGQHRRHLRHDLPLPGHRPGDAGPRPRPAGPSPSPTAASPIREILA